MEEAGRRKPRKLQCKSQRLQHAAYTHYEFAVSRVHDQTEANGRLARRMIAKPTHKDTKPPEIKRGNVVHMNDLKLLNCSVFDLVAIKGTSHAVVPLVNPNIGSNATQLRCQALLWVH